jgi:hypothetical protein
MEEATADIPNPSCGVKGISIMTVVLIVICTALGLCLVPIIFVSLGLWASTKVEDPPDYH